MRAGRNTGWTICKIRLWPTGQAGAVAFGKISLTIIIHLRFDRINAVKAMKEIRFYRANEKPYGAFSNLFRRPILFEGATYATAEHAYQAGKARRVEVREWLMAAPSPALLAMAAHGLYQWDITPGWSRIKFDRMRAVLHAKFTQHLDLADLLLDTGNARLIETATVDNAINRLWGEVEGKGGQNILGTMLMEVRDKLSQLRYHSPKVLQAAE
jgi:ribA/ribD-fused uncharacterized protein